MNAHHRRSRPIRPVVDQLGDRCLLSVAVIEVLNKSSYNVTANFRWTPSSSWTKFTETPGQGELFWNTYSNGYAPQVQFNTTTSASSQTTLTLGQGYGQFTGTGTPPASSATVYQFQNTTTGLQLYYGSAPQTDVVDHPAAAAAYSNVNLPLFASSGPSYLDVHQGDVGDCWLEASLAEVAARDPQDIRNMFFYDGTTVENGITVGLYTVRLYSNAGTAEYITVDTELPSGGNYYDHPNGDLWVALAEKAYAQANGDGYVTTSINGSDSYNALNSGQPVWALHAITGKAASSFSVNPTNIASAWNAGELIVLTTNTPSNTDIVGGHAYAVVAYNASSSMPFEVYNPWGTNSSGWALGTYNNHQVYGLFNASAAFISQNFVSQSIGSGSVLDEQRPRPDDGRHREHEARPGCFDQQATLPGRSTRH